MDLSFAHLLLVERFEMLLAMPFAQVWLIAAFLGLTASIYATGIPGALLPISFSSGALLGEAWGTAAVTTGALLGSLVLYGLLERTSQATLRRRYGEQLKRLDGLAARGGILPLIGLRLAGAPHLAVTVLCTLASVDRRRYALATLAGVLPAIALSTTAGAAL